MREKNLLGFYSFGTLFVFASYFLGNLAERHQSFPLLFAYTSFFVSYLFLIQNKKQWIPLFSLGILSRVVLFFSLPVLSDDVYRFIWDGILLDSGIHPFAELPTYYLDHPVDGLDKALFNKLNSPEYFTIYPPINQGLFWLSIQFGDHWLLSTNILRSVLLAADIGSFFLLRAVLKCYDRDQHPAFWYFLNPLVVLETTGNLHFEGLVVFFILIGIYGWKKGKPSISILGWGLSIGTKLLPLIYLPYLFFVGLKNKKWQIAIASGVLGILTLTPLLNQTFIEGMSSSLDLYFRKFEFNASIYFLARAAGEWIYGYNNIALIGPLLSGISFVSILLLGLVSSHKQWWFPSTLMFTLLLYLSFGTIIHPWYIIPLILFGVISNYKFPILWSYMIFLTYLGYLAQGFELPLWIVSLEYGLVATCLVLESRK